ncbi:MAG: heavy metal translocating P-type ATPase [Endomicrobium sp.]|jgi:heavy metal translocating P-type ATPase|nr:heavy metal translocating P-type ATPase [Endomicrobium sp.]
MEKKTFDITGMTCSACSARIDKAVSKLDGVKSVNVNLLKNTMTVSFDASVSGADKIIQKVEDSGYGAVLQGSPAAGTLKKSAEDAAKREADSIKKRFIASLAFTVPLMYIAMGEMFGLAVPAFLKGMQNAGIFSFTQFLLAVPVIFINRRYFQNGLKNLAKLSPNMDSLIALGSGAAFVYGIYAVYKISYGLGISDAALAHKFSMNLYFESAAMILTLITFGKFLEARAKGKTSGAITKLINLAPKTAVAVRNGKEQEILLEDIAVGEILIVKAGDTVPVDGFIEEGNAALDESAITGESLPADKAEGDKVTGGAVNIAGYFKMKAAAVGEDTALARIIRLVDEASSSKAPVAKLADKISAVFVPAVIIIAVGAAAFWLISGQSFEFALSIGISVLVISCPCALGLATPAAIMVGIGRGAANGILIKSAEALETAKSVDTAVLDKTGTLTEGKPAVTDIKCFGIDEKTLLSSAASIEKMSGHPLASAVVQKAKERGAVLQPVKNYVFIHGQGVKGEIGADEYLCGNRKMMESAGIDMQKYSGEEENASSGGRISLYFAVNKKLAGIIILADTIKTGSFEAVEKFKLAGIDVFMLTGDNQKTAEAIGRLSGIDKIIAGVLPEDKEEKIRSLQNEGRKVAMIGDGINDAPALARADVGIAIGAGTDIAVESADIVLVKSDLNDAVTAINLSRAVMRNIKQNFFWAFIYNIIGIPVAAGVLYGSADILLSPMIAAAAMSFSSVSVVSNALRLRFFNKDKKGKHMKKVIKIEGMSCGHCAAAVTKALKAVPGISNVEVNLEAKEAVVETAGTAGDERLKKAVGEAGYEVKAITDCE